MDQEIDVARESTDLPSGESTNPQRIYKYNASLRRELKPEQHRAQDKTQKADQRTTVGG